MIIPKSNVRSIFDNTLLHSDHTLFLSFSPHITMQYAKEIKCSINIFRAGEAAAAAAASEL